MWLRIMLGSGPATQALLGKLDSTLSAEGNHYSLSEEAALRTKEYRSKTEEGLAKKSRKQNTHGWRFRKRPEGKDERTRERQGQ